MPAHSESARAIARLDCARARSFGVAFADGLATGESPEFAAAIAGRCVIAVTTPSVDRLYGEPIRKLLSQSGEHRYAVLRLDEGRKRLDMVERLCRLAGEFHLDRRGVLVAFGGGVCSDVVTVAASMIRRGIEHIRVPTTLIGQIDAGIGVKGAVNLADLKSFVGVFHPPAAVFVEPRFLESLPPARIRQGLAEILKMALIRDRALFELLDARGVAFALTRFQSPQSSRDVIARAITLMLEELQDNPFEDQSLQRLVDMGHTFSPTLEARSGFQLSHGEAVSIDMALSCVIATELGLLAADDARRFIGLLARLGLPVNSRLLTAKLCRDAMKSVTAHRAGRLNLVVPTALGAATFVDNDALEGGLLERALGKLPWFAPRVALDDDARPAHRHGQQHARQVL